MGLEDKQKPHISRNLSKIHMWDITEYSIVTAWAEMGRGSSSHKRQSNGVSEIGHWGNVRKEICKAQLTLKCSSRLLELFLPIGGLALMRNFPFSLILFIDTILYRYYPWILTFLTLQKPSKIPPNQLRWLITTIRSILVEERGSVLRNDFSSATTELCLRMTNSRSRVAILAKTAWLHSACSSHHISIPERTGSLQGLHLYSIYPTKERDT